MANQAVWFEVMGKDRDALTGFYTDLFDWKATEMDGPMDYSSIETGGESPIGGGIGASPDGGPSYATFYVHVDDVEASLSKAESLGGKKVMGPMDIPDGNKIGLFTDPEGHTIGLFQGTMQR
jgi:hypothetical protein